MNGGDFLKLLAVVGVGLWAIDKIASSPARPLLPSPDVRRTRHTRTRPNHRRAVLGLKLCRQNLGN
jgi:hypothetical protein